MYGIVNNMKKYGKLKKKDFAGIVENVCKKKLPAKSPEMRWSDVEIRKVEQSPLHME